MLILAYRGAKSRNCLNNFMDYLANYYKNLSEQLSHKIKLLENFLYEMDTQISAGNVSAETSASSASKTDVYNNPFSPRFFDSDKPNDPDLPGLPRRPPTRDPNDRNFNRGSPPDPGPQPQPRDGETEEQYQERLRAWQDAVRRRELWFKIRGYNVYNVPGGENLDIRVWPNPPRMPYRRVDNGNGGYNYEALPPFRPGDTYITQNGDVWRVNEQGYWEQVSA